MVATIQSADIGSDGSAAADIAALVTGPPLPHPTLAKTFAAMMAREFRVLRRNTFTTLTRAVLQPLLFVFAFAYVLPKIGVGMRVAGAGSRGGVDFATILVPGLAGSILLTQGVFATLVPLAMEFSWQRTIDDRALAPVPIRMLAIEKIAAGAMQAFLSACIVFPAALFVHSAGQGPQVHVTNWFLFALIMVSGATLTASLGLLLGMAIGTRKIQGIAGVVLVPATMLGCVYYPWSALHSIRWLQIAVLINPMVYISEGLRAVLTPSISHMPLWAVLLVLIGGTAVFGALGARIFRKRVIN
ncbi:MAG: ABC transporter permease [Streptosporangiaceae bacterium]